MPSSGSRQRQMCLSTTSAHLAKHDAEKLFKGAVELGGLNGSGTRKDRLQAGVKEGEDAALNTCRSVRLRCGKGGLEALAYAFVGTVAVDSRWAESCHVDRSHIVEIFGKSM